jgi:hypothetical protein
VTNELKMNDARDLIAQFELTLMGAINNVDIIVTPLWSLETILSLHYQIFFL